MSQFATLLYNNLDFRYYLTVFEHCSIWWAGTQHSSRRKQDVLFRGHFFFTVLSFTLHSDWDKLFLVHKLGRQSERLRAHKFLKMCKQSIQAPKLSESHPKGLLEKSADGCLTVFLLSPHYVTPATLIDRSPCFFESEAVSWPWLACVYGSVFVFWTLEESEKCNDTFWFSADFPYLFVPWGCVFHGMQHISNLQVHENGLLPPL